MRFCPPNITIHDIWINNGVSTCFLETVNSSIVSLFILIFGIGQLIFYWRFATRISDHLPRNCLYNLQVLSHVRWVELCFILWNLSRYNFKTFLENYWFTILLLFFQLANSPYIRLFCYLCIGFRFDI